MKYPNGLNKEYVNDINYKNRGMNLEDDLNVTNKNSIIKINQKIEQNKLNQKLTNTIFCDKIMLKTYPNLKVQCLDGSMIYFKDLLPDIKPYYLRLQEKDFYK